MAPRHRFTSRLILVIAVVACLVGMGHTRTAVAETASAPVAHAMAHSDGMVHGVPTSDGLHRAASGAGEHGGHQGSGDGCCASTAGDNGKAAHALPAHADLVAVAVPLVLDGRAVTPAPPQPRPPDLSSLCVQRT